MSTPGDTTFTYVAAQPIYGGESIVLDLPHYTGTDGAVFGVTSMPSDAFTTYGTSNDLADNGIDEDKVSCLSLERFHPPPHPSFSLRPPQKTLSQTISLSR